MPIRDLSNQRFSRLIALKVAGKNKSGNVIWLCKCDCGNTIEVASTRLVEEKTRSCGCLSKELTRTRLKQLHERNIKPEAPINRVVSSYKRHAEKKHLPYELTQGDFVYLSQLPCFYCKAPPSNKSISQAGNVFIYNGIDRINPKLGYIRGNCVPCCKPCNWMKKDMSLQEFFAKIYAIARLHL